MRILTIYCYFAQSDEYLGEIIDGYLILDEIDEIKVLDSHFENFTHQKSVYFTVFAQSSSMISLLCLNVKVKPNVLLIPQFSIIGNLVPMLGLNIILFHIKNYKLYKY